MKNHPPRRSTLELLEARIAPATLDVTGGLLTYTASPGVVNVVTFGGPAANYVINDTGETITLTANALAAGFTGSGTNTVTGLGSAVSAHHVLLGDQNDQLILQNVNDPMIADGEGGVDTITINSALQPNGALTLSAETINVSSAISAATTVTLTADTMTIGAAIGASGRVILHSQSPGEAIDLGTKTAGKLSFAGAEIGRVTAGLLQIGDTSAGSINISAAISPAAGTSTLALLTGGAIGEGAAGAITVTNLRLSGAGGGTLLIANNVGTLAAAMNGGLAFVNGTHPLAIGTVDGVSGLTSLNNTDMAIAANNLDIQQNISAGSGAVTLQAFSVSTGTSLGSPDIGSTLGLTDAELDHIFAGTLRIGSSVSAAIDVAAPISLTNVTTLALISGGTISGPSSLAVAKLRLSAGGAVSLTSTSNDVDTLAASVTGSGANFAFTDADDLSIGTVDGATGLTVNTAAITLQSGATTQAAGANVTATQLALLGAGPFTFTNPGNNVGTLAANVTGALSFTDVGALSVGTVGSTSGVFTTNSAIFLKAAGGLTVTNATATATPDLEAGTSTITLLAGAVGADVPIAINASAIVHAAGDITFTADNMAILGQVNAGTGLVKLAPFESATTVNLGSADAAGALGITDTELDLITAGTIAVAGAGTGSVNVTGLLSPVNAANLTLTADSMTINATVNVGGIATLEPLTAGELINLGTKTAGALAITDAELDQINAGVIRVGSATAGELDVTGAIFAANTQTLSLISGGSIIALSTISQTNLRIDAGTGFTGTSNNLVNKLAVHTNSGTINFTDRSSLFVIATVDGTTGLTADSVFLTTDNVDVQQPITASGDVTFQTNQNGPQINLGDTTGGLDLTDAELDLITAGSITFRSSFLADINVSGSISPAHSPLLALRSGAGIFGGGTIAVGSLDLVGRTDIQLVGPNHVATLAAKVTGGGLLFGDDEALTIGTVTLEAGVQVSGGIALLAASISQTAPIVCAGAGFTSTAGGIVLTDAGNDFTAEVKLFSGAASASITDANDLVLGAQSIGSALNIKATGTATQTGAFTGAGGLAFDGGTLILSEANTYAGATTIHSGTLAGSGAVAGNLTIDAGGTLSPGSGPALFSAGSVSFAGGSHFTAELNGLAAGQHDQLKVTGAVSLDGMTLALSTGFTAADGDKIVLIDNQGGNGITGTFAGLPEGTVINAGGSHFFQISYHGGNGHDVELTALSKTVALSKDKHSITYTDGDGDLVTIKTTTKATFTADEFTLVPLGGAIGGSTLAEIDLGVAFKNLPLTITAKRGPLGGDGFVNVGYVNAAGVDLGAVSIAGDLGRIDVGAVTSLTVQSLGGFGLATQLGAGSLTSHFTGKLGRLTVKSSIHGATLLGSTTIGPVSVLGSFLGGELSAGADLGAVNIRGNIVGTTASPVVISAFGKAIAPKKGIDLAIASLTVGGEVESLRVLAGYDLTLTGKNADASIGAITVGADWRASTVLAGVSAGADGLDGTIDDAKLNVAGMRDTVGIFSQIASITIKGQAFGTLAGGDSFGIVAEQIGRAKVGAVTLPFKRGSRTAGDFFAIGATGDFAIGESVV
ncbi:MAG TPA: autotransporter-associated beta strand repeat-containing protein [Chthoniobacteraceae bacterium]|nr:autotransporter-associated beta strand repeat-containing protein [Chthoniobacteraceae bacterium]